MLAEVLWPEAIDLRVDKINIVEGTLVVTPQYTQEMARCPACQESKSRIHSRYQRCAADLPCVGYSSTQFDRAAFLL